MEYKPQYITTASLIILSPGYTFNCWSKIGHKQGEFVSDLGSGYFLNRKFFSSETWEYMQDIEHWLLFAEISRIFSCSELVNFWLINLVLAY